MIYLERIVDVETGETTERPYTSEEIAKVEAAQAEVEERQKTKAALAAEKVSLLARLGITEDEAKLLLS
jgi:hypothetical protein